MRAALGAVAARIARELLVESLGLGVMGGLLGLALAYLGLRVFVVIGPSTLPRLEEIGVLSAGARLHRGGFARAHVLHGRDARGRRRHGAAPRQLKRMFLLHGLVLSSIGVATGLVAAAALGRLMSSLLFGIAPMETLKAE